MKTLLIIALYTSLVTLGLTIITLIRFLIMIKKETK